MIGGSFWQKHSLLQQTMTLLQGPKDPVFPSLINFILRPPPTTYLISELSRHELKMNDNPRGMRNSVAQGKNAFYKRCARLSFGALQCNF